MTARLYGQGARFGWNGSRDKDGHRTFKLISKIETTLVHDGPATVMNCPGLPLIGLPWNFGNDLDFWAFCYPDMKITPVVKGEPNNHWEVEQTFSTRPLNRCQDASIDNPLIEPQKVSGSFVTTQKTAAKNRNGVAIVFSNGEPVLDLEFDNSRPTVRIEQNVGNLGLTAFSSMIDTVNGNALWGLAARTIKLSGISWTRNFWGMCNVYYTRTFEFEINYNTFDRSDIINRSQKVKPGKWNNENPNVWVPDNVAGEALIQAVDHNNVPTHFFLDADGNRLSQAATDAGAYTYVPTVEYYPESNFLLLGIPVVF